MVNQVNVVVNIQIGFHFMTRMAKEAVVMINMYLILISLNAVIMDQ